MIRSTLASAAFAVALAIGVMGTASYAQSHHAVASPVAQQQTPDPCASGSPQSVPAAAGTAALQGPVAQATMEPNPCPSTTPGY